MSLGFAMNIAVTGLQTSQTQLDVIGDNIANVNTTGFKSSRADLETFFSLTLREAMPPGVVVGGTNPVQSGLGASVGAINRSFLQGSVATTGAPTDLAIEGAGFFILEDTQGVPTYTRDGAFVLDVNGNLVSNEGLQVQGYAADDRGEIDRGSLTDIVIPLGTLTSARPTTDVTLAGTLNSESIPAAAGSQAVSTPLLTAAGPAGATTPLASLIDENGAALFADGDAIVIRDVPKGGFALPETGFTVGAEVTTVQDLMTFLEGALAVQPDLGDGAGVTLDAQGQIVINANNGLPNALEMVSATILNETQNTTALSFADVGQAIGDGTTTGFIVYDSLGQEVNVRLRMVLESKGETGTVWRYYAESAGDSDVSNALGSGTLSFDTQGQFVGATTDTLTVHRAGTGAADIAFALDFGGLSSLSSTSSLIGLDDQDGLPFGTLVDFSVDRQGIIVGAFSNASTQNLGQVALATFINPQGLELQTGNNYHESLNSGSAQIVTPGEANAGDIESGALEQSNVNLAREFIGLITASTAFSANSRVITTADELLQELLLITR